MISFSRKKCGLIGVAGHVGCGHCHSVNGQVQDDSVGLAVVLYFFQKATGLSLEISDITFDENKIVVNLKNGGMGYGISRRGITPFEKKIIKKIIGKEALMTHTIILEEFGRIYGQGVLEVPVALQSAISNAALDGFYKNFPNNFKITKEDVGDNYGYILGSVLDIEDIPVSFLATVNCTLGGIGPNEDLEGNSNYFSKKTIVENFRLDTIPTIVLESKFFNNALGNLNTETFIIRGDEEDDNLNVVKALIKACDILGYPALYYDSGSMKRKADSLKLKTIEIGQKIEKLGNQLSLTNSSEKKVEIVAELAILISQDCGGVTFMSNHIHDDIGGVGLVKKTGAVLSLGVSKKYIVESIIPYLTEEDLEKYYRVVLKAISILNL
ncbi:hypothetical protein H5J22_01375 [Cetobacterium sp. 8H]|uniref:hypothetical protein n=1 Tax=Cetobacterium sp. 8H TaxID=2759681 RepID=UPI00163C36AB|nr:hypothetical protein [Cetobacterium sp. 8H]MBC2850113.1 hypothetical protein [Cetobacterium sp. 8H]